MVMPLENSVSMERFQARNLEHLDETHIDGGGHANIQPQIKTPYPTRNLMVGS